MGHCRGGVFADVRIAPHRAPHSAGRETFILSNSGLGPDLVFGRLWDDLGCRDVLRGMLADRQFGFDVERAVCLAVLHRLVVSGSDRQASAWRLCFQVTEQTREAVTAWI